MEPYIVITGLLDKSMVEPLINTYQDFQHKCISTWKDQNPILLHQLELAGFKIILNDYPENKNSTNVQQYATYQGLCIAKSQGFTHAIRMRTDVKTSDMKKFIEYVRPMYDTKITCFCGIETNDGLYHLDIMYVGPINEMLYLYEKEQPNGDGRFTEMFQQEEYYGQCTITLDVLKSNINFCYNLCEQHQIDFFWKRNNRYKSIMNEYCKENFIRL